MATALGFRCLYRTRPAPLCRHVDRLWRNQRRGHRLSPADDELYQRTRISLLQNEFPQAIYIDSYSSRGFTISGNRVFGPCALLPQTVVQWNVGCHQDITEESFSLFWMLEPRIEIVVVGTGNKTERLHSQVLQAMRQRGIAVEVQDTPNACATYNFLCHEGRVTGAALIPPAWRDCTHFFGSSLRMKHQQLSRALCMDGPPVLAFLLCLLAHHVYPG